MKKINFHRQTNRGSPTINEPLVSKTAFAVEMNGSDQTNHKFKAMLNALLVPCNVN